MYQPIELIGGPLDGERLVPDPDRECGPDEVHFGRARQLGCSVLDPIAHDRVIYRCVNGRWLYIGWEPMEVKEWPIA